MKIKIRKRSLLLFILAFNAIIISATTIIFQTTYTQCMDHNIKISNIKTESQNCSLKANNEIEKIWK